VDQGEGLVAGADDPLVAPLTDRHQYGPQRFALVGEDVVVTAPRLVVAAAFEHAVADEGVEPLGQDVAGNAEPCLELLEAGDAEERVAEDQQRPPLADHLEGPGDRAVHVFERRSPHMATVAFRVAS